MALDGVELMGAGGAGGHPGIEYLFHVCYLPVEAKSLLHPGRNVLPGGRRGRNGRGREVRGAGVDGEGKG